MSPCLLFRKAAYQTARPQGKLEPCPSPGVRWSSCVIGRGTVRTAPIQPEYGHPYTPTGDVPVLPPAPRSARCVLLGCTAIDIRLVAIAGPLSGKWASRAASQLRLEFQSTLFEVMNHEITSCVQSGSVGWWLPGLLA